MIQNVQLLVRGILSSELGVRVLGSHESGRCWSYFGQFSPFVRKGFSSNVRFGGIEIQDWLLLFSARFRSTEGLG